MGARNLQDETATYPDLEDAFERSQYDWLGYGDLRKIFDSCDELPLSTAPVDPFEQEGLYLFEKHKTVDMLDSFKVYGDKSLYGDEEIQYELGRCDLEPLDKGVKSVLERRIYRSVVFEKFRLAHYRITHHAGGQSSEDTDETVTNSAGSNGNGDASGDIQDDDALSALNTDISHGHDADASDIAPVPTATASTTIVMENQDIRARNLQDETETYPDLEDAFERSQYDWLGYGDLRKIFDSCDELPLSTAPVDPFEQEGLYLFEKHKTVDMLDSFKVYGDKSLYGDEEIQYELGRCDLEPLDKGVKSVLERRIYRSVVFEKFRLAHYRITHHAGGQSSEDTDETVTNSAGSNGNGDASGDIQDDDALSALNTDISHGHDADASDIAPVPTATASTTNYKS